MARVPYLDKKDLAPENQDLLNRPINLYRAMVNSPNGRRAASHLGHYIRYDTKLDPRLRELSILEVGYLARSPYEWSHHVKIGHEFGVTDDDIRGLIDWNEGRPNRLDELTRIVLQATREMTIDLGFSDASFASLAQHMDMERLVDLVLTIGHYNSTVRILASLQIDVESEYTPYLDKFPLPKG